MERQVLASEQVYGGLNLDWEEEEEEEEGSRNVNAVRLITFTFI
jgi:hypothetical protein